MRSKHFSNSYPKTIISSLVKLLKCYMCLGMINEMSTVAAGYHPSVLLKTMEMSGEVC